MRKEIALGISVPAAFVISAYCFLNFVPSNDITTSNIINFFASLASLVMVIIVVATTAMQLEEMKSSKLLQSQPFPKVNETDKCYFEKLRLFFFYPEANTNIQHRLFFNITVENIGNAPLVALDIKPLLKYYDTKGNAYSKSVLCESIDSMKESEKKEVELFFVSDNEDKKDFLDCMVSCYLNNGAPCGGSSTKAELILTLYYKNILGANFKQDLTFDIFFVAGEGEKIKSYFKIWQNAKIDYINEMKAIDSISKTDDEKSNKLYEQLKEQLSKREGNTEIAVRLRPRFGAFSISSISEKNYKKHVKSRKFPKWISVKA